MRCRNFRFISLILISLLSTIALTAQSVQSTLLGTVKDQSGAVIPGAKIVITDTDTRNSASYITDASGNFQALDLPPGKYQVQVTKAGFQRKMISDLGLTARQQLRVDVSLGVGTAQQDRKSVV